MFRLAIYLLACAAIGSVLGILWRGSASSIMRATFAITYPLFVISAFMCGVCSIHAGAYENAMELVLLSPWYFLSLFTPCAVVGILIGDRAYRRWPRHLNRL